MQKWEYLSVQIFVDSSNVTLIAAINDRTEKRKPFLPYLQSLGDQGWEMVGSVSNCLESQAGA